MGGNQEGTPLVWNNTIYGITNWSVVFAAGRSHREANCGVGIPEVNQVAVQSEAVLRES